MAVLALAAAPLLWGCSGRVAGETSDDNGGEAGQAGGSGGTDTPAPTDVPSQPLSPADLSKACTKDLPFPRRLLRMAAPEVVASLRKAAPNATLSLPAELKDDTQSQRADDSLVVSRSFYDSMDETARAVAKQLREGAMSPLTCDVAKFGVEAACTTTFLGKWLPAVFRGRNDAADSKALAALAQTIAGRSGGQSAFDVVIRATLQSPKFLYLPEGIDALLAGKAQGNAPLSGPELAAFLSYRVLGEPPSDALMKAAGTNPQSLDAVVNLVKQQFSDQQRQAATAGFLRSWLSTSDIAKLTRDKTKHPQADATFLVKLRDETDGAIAKAAADSSVGLTSFLTSPQTSALLDGTGGQTRPGFFALPGVVAASSAADHTNIPRRGRVLMRELFCEEAVPPPPGVTAKAPSVPEGSSERQRFDAIEGLPSCAACHTTIDHLAYPFEAYDEMGRARTKDEHGNTINGASMYLGADGVVLKFENATELMTKAAESPLVKGCFALQAFRHEASRFERGDADACLVRDLATTVADSKASLLDVLTAALARTAFANRGDK